MAPSIKVFVQVALLCCVVTTSMGGIIDWEKEFSQLENKVEDSKEEIKSLHKIIQKLEKRLEQLEANGEFGEVLIQPEVPTYSPCLLVKTILLPTIKFMSLSHCMMSPYIGKWHESIL